MRARMPLAILGAAMCLVATAYADGQAPAAKFLAGPQLAAEGKAVRIRFEVDRATDVAVEIRDAAGRTVRHLAAGLLGPHAPEPLAAGALEQSLLWDRTDDDGRPVAGPCTAFVGLGLQARYGGEYGGGCKPAAELPWDGRDIDSLRAIAGAADGTIYMLGGWWHPHLDRNPHLIALDRAGNYVREVYPPPAAMLAERTPGMPKLALADGSLVPQVQSWWDLFIPQMTDAAAMAATADGHLLLATTAPDYVAERRALLKIGADGAIPADAWALKLPPGMDSCGFSMAASPDSKLLYVSGTKTTRPAAWRHCVDRLKLDGGNEADVFFGVEKEAGADEKHLSQPAGVAVDGQGNVYIADYGNDRVLVVGADGKLQRQFAVKQPFAVQLGPAGSVYVLSCDWLFPKYMEHVVNRTLRKFSAEGKQLAEVDVTTAIGYRKVPLRFAGMATDAASSEVVLSIGGTSYPDGCNGYPHGYSYGIVRVTDDGKKLSEPTVLNLTDAVQQARIKQWNQRSAAAVQRDGFRYGYLMRSPGDPSVIWMTRADAKGQPAPWPKAGEDKWVALLGRRSSRFWFRALVGYDGDIFAEYYNYASRGDQNLTWKSTAAVDRIAPDGTVRKREFVYGLREGTYGLKVDRKGCLYVADHLLPAGRLAPAEIEAAFAKLGDGKVAAAYVSTYGSVCKIGPDGGGFVWGKAPETAPPAGDLVREPKAVWEPAHPSREKAVCENVQWQFLGGSPLPATLGKCICSGIGFDLDGHARVFIPDAYRMCIHVLDTNGNLLLRFGRYGNQDDARTGALVFARPRFISASDGRIIVTDPQNGRGVKVDLAYATEKSLAIP